MPSNREENEVAEDKNQIVEEDPELATQSSSNNQIDDHSVRPKDEFVKHPNQKKQSIKKKDFLDDFREAFELDKTPRRLGNYICFWYNNHY